MMTTKNLHKFFIPSLYILIFSISLPLFKIFYQNDYLNPYTITFKNPKTIQMYNIMILYHYVMTFLIGIIIFTFIFIFLSFFRTYFFFHVKLMFPPNKMVFKEIFYTENYLDIFPKFLNWIRYNLYINKFKFMNFYKEDIKSSLKDQVSHAPVLEFFWVIFPALILVAIAYPSVVMLYYNESYVDPVFNITVIGNQWYWTYEYNDFNVVEIFKKHLTHENFVLGRTLDDIVMYINEQKSKVLKNFSGQKLLKAKDKIIFDQIPKRLTIDSNMIIAKDPKFLRLLTTDQCLVIPSKTPIRLLITSNDVIHSWAVPSYGVKLDAVPGRINQQILNIPLVGTSWGQCSELCGVNHAFMPIEIKVLAFNDFILFMHLRLKEILFPLLVDYYKERTVIIKNLCTVLKEKINNGGLTGESNFSALEKIFNKEKLSTMKKTLSSCNLKKQ